MIQLQPNHKIQLLPEHIIDQIKAGEVIERPATLLKELIENSLDAGATKVKVEIEDNGLALIHVADNGEGISFSELPLAFCRHATSKIERFEDIYNLFTYGFRGEALASMASISRISCTSTHNQQTGTIKVEGGEVISHEPSSYESSENGTSIFVKDLFYNTPVRLKFIQSKTSEKNQLKKMLASFVLTKRNVEFSIRFDGGPFKKFPATDNFEDRINTLFFPKSPIKFLKNERSFEDIDVEVYLSTNFSRGSAGKQQFIFVNDRYIQDTTIHKIVQNSASHLWDFGQSGHYFLFIRTGPHLVDVNVHPNKINVKFFTPGKVHSLISQTIKELKSLTKELTPNIPIETEIPSPARIHSFVYQGTSFDHLVDFTTEQKSTFNVQKLTNRYYLVNFEDEVYVLDGLIFAINLLLNTGQKSQIIPLMVATPIRNLEHITQDKVDILSKLGLHLELLNADTLLLQAYPEELEAFNTAKIIELLVKFLDFSQELNLCNIQFNLSTIEVDLELVNNQYELNRLLQNILSISKDRDKYLAPLNDKIIKKIFYE